MKKRKLGLCLGVILSLAMATTAFSGSQGCYTTISSNGDTAMGVTSFSGADYCSASLTAVYVGGGVKSAFAEGVNACSVSVYASNTMPFTAASTTHRVDVEETLPFTSTLHKDDVSIASYSHTTSAAR